MAQRPRNTPPDSPDTPSLDLSEMVGALTDEIRAEKQARLSGSIELGRGRLRSPVPAMSFEYEYLCDVPLREGDRGTFEVDGRKFPAEVVARRVDKKGRPTVVLRFQPLLGDIAPGGVLTLESGTLARLREHLAGLPAGFNRALAWNAIGVPASVANPADSPDLEWLSERLNEEQLRAVAQTFSQSVSLTWGPPGTGKTRTLVAAAEAHYRAGHSILIAAPTHSALDRIVEAAEPWLKTIPGYGDGSVLRLGKIGCPILAARLGGQIELKGVLDRWAENREREIEALTVDRAHAVTPEARRAIDFRLAELERNPGPSREGLVHRANVVFATTHQSYLSPVITQSRGLVTKSTVFVDEAGMVSLPLLFATAGLAMQRVAIFGDFRQLPPVVKSRTARANHWLGRTGFEGHQIAVLDAGDPHHLTVLTEQHRMAPAIGDLVSDTSYGGRLRTAATVRQHRPPMEALPTGGLHLLDTTSLGASAVIRNGSRCNEAHAEVIAELVGSLQGADADPVDALVLTPYRAQVETLSRSLRRARVPARATTIHRAQGSEADVVIVDLVETDPWQISAFLRAQSPDDLGARLLNVAVSRAKRAVVVVAAVAPLLRSPATGRFVKAFLRKLQGEGRLDAFAYQRPARKKAG